MNIVSPHLPPPTCSVPLHQRFRTLRSFLVIVFVSLLAGFTGGATLLAWVWPRYVNSDVLFVTNRQNVKAMLSDQTMRDVAERTGVVYTRNESLVSGVSVFSAASMLGRAAIVSSDGWLAMPATGETFLPPAHVLLSGQKIAVVEKFVEDKEAKIIYIKIAMPDVSSGQSGQFKVISFVEKVGNGDTVFVENNGAWEATSVIESGGMSENGAHIDTVPVQKFWLADARFAKGSLVVNSSGKLVGSVGDNNALTTAETIARVVGSVLTTGSAAYKSLGVEGWFSGEAPVVVQGAVKNGFLVSKVRDAATKLKRGDVVTEIQGVMATEDAWWAAINAGGEVALKVWRQGKELMLTTPVVTISR